MTEIIAMLSVLFMAALLLVITGAWDAIVTVMPMFCNNPMVCG